MAAAGRTPSWLHELGRLLLPRRRTSRKGADSLAFLSPKRFDGGRQRWHDYTDRYEVPIRDTQNALVYQEIDAWFSRARRALDKLANDCVSNHRGDDRGFYVQVHARDARLRGRLEEILKALIRRTGLGGQAKSLIRRMLRDGDRFVEVAFDLDGLQSVRAAPLPTWEMFRIHDDRGELLRFEQRRDVADSHPIVWEVPAQIVHFRYCPGQGPYGLSLWHAHRLLWERIKNAAEDLAVASRTRAPQRYKHVLGRDDDRHGYVEYSEEEIRTYRERTQDDPKTILTDFYVKKGLEDVEALAGDSQGLTAQQEYLRYLVDQFVEDMGVPGLVAGNVADVAGRHVSQSIEADYARTINGVRQDFTLGLDQLITTELALNGYRDVEFEVVWPELGAESPLERARRVVLLRQAGLLSARSALVALGAADPEAELQEIRCEAGGGGPRADGSPSNGGPPAQDSGGRARPEPSRTAWREHAAEEGSASPAEGALDADRKNL